MQNFLFSRLSLGALLLILTALTTPSNTTAAEPAESYPQLVLADEPVAYWRFEKITERQVPNQATSPDAARLVGKVEGQVQLDQAGPRPPRFTALDAENQAIALGNGRGLVRIADPGPDSPLDFAQGDAITLEAWVNPYQLADNQQVYLVGKGRTHNPGMASENQNYALRLRGEQGGATISFLFRDARNRKGHSEDYHRWNSKTAFPLGSGWHHVAVSYVFGQPESIRGYLDGVPVEGFWDFGGATTEPPVVDDDEVWIGTSLGGNPSSTLSGQVDEIAIYRTALPAERFKLRATIDPAASPVAEVTYAKLPDDAVLVEILEGMPDAKSWEFTPQPATETFTERYLAMVELPQRYNDRGLRADRSSPFVLRASARVVLPEGEQRILVRSRNAARLFLDGRQIAAVPFSPRGSDGHNAMYELDYSEGKQVRAVQPGDRQGAVTLAGDGKLHVLRLETLVGGQKRRPELGELSVSIGPVGGPYHLITPAAPPAALTDEAWHKFADAQRVDVTRRNTLARREANAIDKDYWSRRHQLARDAVASRPPLAPPAKSEKLPAHNDIDHFLNAELEKENIEPAELIDDLGFIRRLSLDTRGLIPTTEEVQAFLADERPDARARLIDQFLADPSWADNWVGYWQDVLAENPNLVNPTLNNTGPFRWWLHEAFSDNKPFDRFATEAILMQGSKYYGGPGGFEMATENDAPMAAKAHILGRAFLAMEMNCARCHDAPHHRFAQKDLFSVAAMLQRGPQQVPKTSTIQRSPEELEQMAVQVTLKPGEKVPPQWPFADLVADKLPADVLRNAQDSRERLAALITSPDNDRFAQVIVNRLWQRYLGRGLADEVDDWESVRVSNPELLDYLARELMTHDYDLKHVARVIFNSHAYQRIAAPPSNDGPPPQLFATPLRRRMSAEQLVDSLFRAAGKEFGTEPLNLDTDTSRSFSQSLNLGTPSRAWHFTSLANERDRPSLALPGAATFVSVLEAFGWRDARQSPLTVRDTDPLVIQPAILANGVVAKRVAQLSEDSALTQLALQEQSVETLVEATFLRILSRPPSASEQALFVELLKPDYDERRVSVDPSKLPQPVERPNLVTWTNHLQPRANEYKQELEREIQKGDVPTPRLQAEWRERMEDMIWTLINTPEFVFLP